MNKNQSNAESQLGKAVEYTMSNPIDKIDTRRLDSIVDHNASL